MMILSKRSRVLLLLTLLSANTPSVLAHHAAFHTEIPPQAQPGAILQHNQAQFNLQRTQPWLNSPLQSRDIDFRGIQDDVQVLSTQGQILPYSKDMNAFEIVPNP